MDSGHDTPTGLWSDGAILWIAQNGDGADDAIYAYGLRTGERVEDRALRLDERNSTPRGVWSDGTTMWIADSGQGKLFAYGLETSDRLPDADIGTATRNRDPRGIWSGGVTVWVLDGSAGALFAYDIESGDLLAEYALHSANDSPNGIWSDGVTVWVSNDDPKSLFAYRLPALPDEAVESGEEEARELERVRDEEFGRLSGAGNNSPRGIWSDGEVMYVADENDNKVYTYNMPDAIDARLASLSLSGIDIGEFDPGRTEYQGTFGEGLTETVVSAEAIEPATTVAIEPPDTEGDVEGYQVAVEGHDYITITVTSADGSRSRVYRVRLAEPAWDPVRDLWPHCLSGAVVQGFSLVVYEGGSIEELVECAESRGIAAFHILHEGVYVSYILGAPDFVNREFRELFPDGLAAMAPLVAGSNGPPSADPFGDDLDHERQQPWPECLRGTVVEGFSLVVYEGGSVQELGGCAASRHVTALYALQEGEFVPYVPGAPDFVNRAFHELYADGLAPMAPLVAKSTGPPVAGAGGGAAAEN